LFVADYFAEQVVGGAELTTESIIKDSPVSVQKILSSQINVDFVKQHKDEYWIFGNFSMISKDLLLFIAKNLKYSVIEYDYKYCKYRSPEKHTFYEKKCECENERDGKIVSIFLAKASSLWFMSQQQKDYYEKKFDFLQKDKSFVLSSILSSETLQYIKDLKTDDKSNEWLVLDSESWIKGTNSAIEYASKNNLKARVIKNLPHRQLLAEMAIAKGLIFLPPGMDTCPRVVIEAKLLGCELALNKNVQHLDEEWFINEQEIYNYLENRTSFFWNEISKEI
tara:strand:+ start:926 stop:1765 length:840 start_codon:yes stop_codon:yes gene_type:complete